MNSLVARALEFATKAHEGQVRKCTGEPYINHLIEVMEIVRSVRHTDEMLAAALLHDVVQDTPVTIWEIETHFGPIVSGLVLDLTGQCFTGNRTRRKHLEALRLSRCCNKVRTIKMADMISNRKTIEQHDAKFAKVYLREMDFLMQLFTEGAYGADDLSNKSLRAFQLKSHWQMIDESSLE